MGNSGQEHRGTRPDAADRGPHDLYVHTIVTYDQAAARLARLERDWRVLSPAQRNATALKDLVTRGETVLKGESIAGPSR